MPRNTRKKFHRFLARRRQRLHQPKPWVWLVLRLSARPKAIAFALWPPLAVAAAYGLMRVGHLFTSLYPAAHMAAFAILFVWFFAALRGAVGYWSRWGHVRYAVLFFALAGFGSCWGLGLPAAGIKAWVTPPAYARLPSEPLKASLWTKNTSVLAGSLLHVSQTEPSGAAGVVFMGKEKTLGQDGDEESTVSFAVPEVGFRQSATLFLRRGLRRLGFWPLTILPDDPPRISFTEEPEITARKTVRLAFDASDDYGVETVFVRITPSPAASASAPGGGNAPVDVVLARPGVKAMRSAGYADLTALPWAGFSVALQLVAVDGAGHQNFSAIKTMMLPARVFHNPFARTLIEERQKLSGAPDASARDEAANVMAGIARQQGIYRGDTVVLVALRAAAVRLVLGADQETIAAVRDVMWKTALRLEEGAIGLARSDLAAAERDLSAAIARQTRKEELSPYFLRMKQAMDAYFAVLEAEKAKQPPSLQEMNWPLATDKEVLAPEDLQNRLDEIGPLLDSGLCEKALERLGALQALIENLRTTPPELTPTQYKLVEQTSALRALVRGQKKTMIEAEALLSQEKKTSKGREAWHSGLAHLLAQQQILFAALQEIAQKIELPSRLEAKAGEKAMNEAIEAIQGKDILAAQQKQAEALALMENSLLTLSETMRQSLTAKAP